MIIYKTTNLINGKIYIGQSLFNNLYYLGSGKLFKKAIKKYGKENFKKEIIIEGVFNQLLLDELEKHYIRLFSATVDQKGYNIALGGAGGIRLRSKKSEYIRKCENQLTEEIVSKKQKSEKTKEYVEASRKRCLKMIKEGKHCFNRMTEEEKKDFGRKGGIAAAKVVGVKVQVFDIVTSKIYIFDTMTKCCKFFNTNSSKALSKAAEENRLYRKRYEITRNKPRRLQKNSK